METMGVLGIIYRVGLYMDYVGSKCPHAITACKRGNTKPDLTII